MTKSQAQQVEDSIVTCIEDDDMTKEEMLKFIVETHKVSPAFVLNAYVEMYEGD